MQRRDRIVEIAMLALEHLELDAQHILVREFAGAFGGIHAGRSDRFVFLGPKPQSSAPLRLRQASGAGQAG
ncbi:hypothetical protein MACH21_22830 [Roseicyclus marinus]|uniref:Uncharacterized protein n=1 Tax=Roseicyclus marinus TaxID=2161673 RepID=A0AA48HKV6_9RHOB|nr:hypothetical protein MACH21_22830 [Roseicyclus marinus]